MDNNALQEAIARRQEGGQPQQAPAQPMQASPAPGSPPTPTAQPMGGGMPPGVMPPDSMEAQLIETALSKRLQAISKLQGA